MLLGIFWFNISLEIIKIRPSYNIIFFQFFMHRDELVKKKKRNVRFKITRKRKVFNIFYTPIWTISMVDWLNRCIIFSKRIILTSHVIHISSIPIKYFPLPSLSSNYDERHLRTNFEFILHFLSQFINPKRKRISKTPSNARSILP